MYDEDFNDENKQDVNLEQDTTPPETGSQETEKSVQLGEYVYGTFFRRAVAVILDGIIMAIVTMVAVALVTIVFGGLAPDVFNNIGILLYVAYYIFMLGRYGQTFGKKWMKVIVVNDDGSSIGYLKAALRLLATTLSGIVFMLGYIIYFFNPQRKTLHDYLVKTIVIAKD